MWSQQGRSAVAEQRPFKPLVVGSTPTAPTNPAHNCRGGLSALVSRLSRSVLVLIDGRTVYTTLFAGTYCGGTKRNDGGYRSDRSDPRPRRNDLGTECRKRRELPRVARIRRARSSARAAAMRNRAFLKPAMASATAVKVSIIAFTGWASTAAPNITRTVRTLVLTPTGRSVASVVTAHQLGTSNLSTT